METNGVDLHPLCYCCWVIQPLALWLCLRSVHVVMLGCVLGVLQWDESVGRSVMNWVSDEFDSWFRKTGCRLKCLFTCFTRRNFFFLNEDFCTVLGRAVAVRRTCSRRKQEGNLKPPQKGGHLLVLSRMQICFAIGLVTFISDGSRSCGISCSANTILPIRHSKK